MKKSIVLAVAAGVVVAGARWYHYRLSLPMELSHLEKESLHDAPSEDQQAPKVDLQKLGLDSSNAPSVSAPPSAAPAEAPAAPVKATGTYGFVPPAYVNNDGSVTLAQPHIKLAGGGKTGIPYPPEISTDSPAHGIINRLRHKRDVAYRTDNTQLNDVCRSLGHGAAQGFGGQWLSEGSIDFVICAPRDGQAAAGVTAAQRSKAVIDNGDSVTIMEPFVAGLSAAQASLTVPVTLTDFPTGPANKYYINFGDEESAQSPADGVCRYFGFGRSVSSAALDSGPLVSVMNIDANGKLTGLEVTSSDIESHGNGYGMVKCMKK